MNKFVSIQEAAKFLGVSTQTLRRWENEGKEIAVERTKGNQRRYDLSKMRPLATGADKLSKGITLALLEYPAMIKKKIYIDKKKC
jgi:excisionase family DNA binding protein